MRKIFYIVVLFFLILRSTYSFSQLQVTPNNNATQLAQALAGPGVVISGATMNCPDNGLTPPNKSHPSGTFIGTASNIGIAGGVLLTTGTVDSAVGPNSSGWMTVNNGVTINDPDLMAIEPLAVHDVCILEFNAVPSCSTLAFTFAFGSEEYPEFVNSMFNDAFGIFVTGPNPSGPAYTGYNMALIPATATAVAINNVNNGTVCPTTGPCMNCAYYTDNCSGTTVHFDGFTKPINVTLNVKPCNSYHFKLAIADAGDNAYDSGVFFAMQSLACNPLPVLIATTSTPSACTANNGTANATPTGGTAPYTYLWNSTPPQTTQLATGLPPGNYTVTVTDVTGCFSNTGTVTVAGNGGFPTTATQTMVSCFGSNDGGATVTPNGGNAPYTYAWSTTPPQTGQTILNIPAGNYTCTVKDVTGCIETQTITITQPPSIIATITNTVNVTCPGGKNGSATASAAGGANPYNYVWNSTPPQAGATASDLPSGNFIVTVTDANGCTTSQSVTITQPVAMSLPSSSTIASCGMTDGTATVNPSGGQAPYTYLWLTTPAVQSTQTANNLASGTYSIIVTDSKGCAQVQSVTVGAGAPPVADFTYSPVIISMLDADVSFTDLSNGVLGSWEWNFGDPNSGVNDSSKAQYPSHTFSDTGVYCITLSIANPTALCFDTIIKCLRVEAVYTIYVPNTFTPNHDGMNDIFLAYGTYIKTFHMMIFDRWGNQIFESNDLYRGWDGSVNNKGKIIQEDIYVWKIELTDTEGAPHTFIGHVNMVK